MLVLGGRVSDVNAVKVRNKTVFFLTTVTGPRKTTLIAQNNKISYEQKYKLADFYFGPTPSVVVGFV